MYCATRRTAGVLTAPSIHLVAALPRRQCCIGSAAVGGRHTGAGHLADTVALLEAAAIALGAGSLDAERLGLARSTGLALRECCHDPAAAAGLARQFHRTLVMACPNAHMIELIDLQAAGARPTRTPVEVDARELEQVADDHEAILDMIATGAGSTDVERRLREHAAHSRLCAVA